MPEDKDSKGSVLRTLGCLALIAAVGMTLVGARETWQGLTNRKLTVVSYPDYLKDRPKAAWIQITDARMLVTDAIVVTKLGILTGAYLPVHGKDEASDAPVRVLLKTEDPATLKRIEALRSAAKTDKSGGNVLVDVAKNGLFIELEVKGLAEKGGSLPDKELKKLRAAEKQLAEDFVVIAQGQEPNLLLALVFLLIGVGGLVALVAVALAKSKDQPPPTAIPVAREVLPPQG